MTEIEEKSLKTQVELAKEIIKIDENINYLIRDLALSTYNNVIRSKEYIKSDQEKVEFTVEEFIIVRDTINKLMSNHGISKINEYIENQYITPRNEKLKILSML